MTGQPYHFSFPAITEDRRFEPVGRCIYCGATQNLETEHIIPEGLSGGWILPDASCRSCADVTGRLETEILRKSLLPIRTLLKLRTKRPKQRPTTVPLRVVRSDGHVAVLHVNPDESVVVLGLPVFAPAQRLGGPPAEDGRSMTIRGFCVKAFHRSLSELAVLHNVARVEPEYLIDPNAFARMVAKIAHGMAYAAASLGGPSLVEPFLPSAILTGEGVGQWVGCAEPAVRPGTPSRLHAVRFHTVTRTARTGVVENALIVSIRLFAHWNFPEYTVLVGRI